MAALTAGDSVQLLAASGDDYLVTDGSQTGYLPQSKACLIIGEISFVTSPDHRYAQATADTPFYTTKTKSKTHGTIPAGDVVEITTQVKGGELYNAVYGGNTGCVLQDSVTLVRKGGVHPTPASFWPRAAASRVRPAMSTRPGSTCAARRTPPPPPPFSKCSPRAMP